MKIGTNEVVEIAIDKLLDFRLESEIYGDPAPDAEFIASVQHRGILTPLTVCTSPESEGFDLRFEIISGHRRKRAAIEAGLSVVPCIVKKYESEEEKELDFLICNMQREKIRKTKIKEFLQYKQILCQIGKARMGKGTYEDIYKNTIMENKHLWRLSKALDLEKEYGEEKQFNTREILREITGFSEWEQKHLKYLYDKQWLQDKYNEMTVAGVPRERYNAIDKEVDAIRLKYENEEIACPEAAKQIKALLDAELKKYEKKTKTKKQAKLAKTEPKPRKPEPAFVMPVAVKFEMSEFPEKALKFNEAESTAEYYFKSGGMSFGVAKSLNRPVGFMASWDNVQVYINPEVLAQKILEYINEQGE